MNANNGSSMGSPRDRQADGWVGPDPLGWLGAAEAAVDESSSTSSAERSPRSDPRVITALETYLDALRSGRPWSREEFLARHAEIAGPLGECLSGLEFIQTASVELEGSDAHRAATRPEPVPLRARLGDYRVLREIGRGGMGVVYEAEQISLGRRVALKVLPFAAAIDPKQRQRFQIEAQAAAQLHHPHIVPIFAVGCDHGIHYYAMQFVEGRSLAAIIRELRSGLETALEEGAPSDAALAAPVSTEEACCAPEDPPGGGPPPVVPLEPSAAAPVLDDHADLIAAFGAVACEDRAAPAPTLIGSVHQDRAFCQHVARLGAEAAEALDHAHGLGILHRDIKPANLLIDGQGAVWITDFGLARFHSDRSITGTGDVVGTLRYMSPEQAQARRGVVDQRTDIYSLGVTLYELLTLRPAFDGCDHHELLRQIALEEPVPPRRLNPAVPRDLETIILKAMAKDLSCRYTTAQELAADLRRFLDDRPILARRPGPVERTMRWAFRHRELVGTAVAVFVVSLILATTLIWAKARETKQAYDNYHRFVIESFSLLDQNTSGAMDLANQLLRGDDAARQEALEILSKTVDLYQRATKLPPTDAPTRVIIARAHTRLGYILTTLSQLKGTNGQFEPGLLAQATADYRKSAADFETLLAQSPGDLKIYRYYADAVGVFGLGCCLRFDNRDAEAEPCYQRSIQLRRELVRGTGSGGATDASARADLARDLNRLVDTVHILGSMLENRGQRAEAQSLRRQLEDDIVALAARFSGEQFHGLRKMLADFLKKGIGYPYTRPMMILNCRLAMILDPENADAHNDLAWALVSAPKDPWFDPQRGLTLARRAVELYPTNWMLWNTLGVAEFRVGEWKTAEETLLKSIGVNGGQAVDWYFLAMTRWHQGKLEEARDCLDRAIAWVQRNNRSEDPELRQFHAEAAATLGLPGPGAPPDAVAGGANKSRHKRETKTTHRKADQPDQPPVETNKRPATFGSQAPAPRDRSEEPISTREDGLSAAGESQSACCGDDRRDAKSSPLRVPVAHREDE